ncbi:MAG: 2-oxoacid:acceptor oxidoreductase family protein [Desulfurococcaceae archaeon]
MLYEIIFLGRGGQGGVTASNILVQAAIYENKYGQSFPFFGAERRGAPVAAYARISDKPILKHGMFNEADVLVVLDDSLIKLGVAKKYTIRENGVLVINTQEKIVTRDQLSARGKVKVFAVNATKIARELGLVVAGWPLVNTPMLGALISSNGFISLENVVKATLNYFGGKLGARNSEAIKRAYGETSYVGEV